MATKKHSTTECYLEDADFREYFQTIYTPSPAQKAVYAQHRRAYLKRQRQARAAQGLNTRTGLPLKRRSHTYFIGPLPIMKHGVMLKSAYTPPHPFVQRYGMSQAQMARNFGVSKEMVSKIWRDGRCPLKHFARRQRGMQRSKLKTKCIKLCKATGYNTVREMLNHHTVNDLLDANLNTNLIEPRTQALLSRFQRRYCL